MACSNRGNRRPVVLSARIFDGATIIAHGDETSGFPVENLQDPQPRRRFRVDTGFSSAYVIVDLQQGPYDKVPTYDVLAALFHNGIPQDDTWRIRTGLDTSGTGRYDSASMPLWPAAIVPASFNYRSSLAYLPEGAHAFHALGFDDVTSENDWIWLEFPGTASDYVDFGDVLDIVTGNHYFLALRFRASGSPANQVLVGKGVSSVTLSTMTGYVVGLKSDGSVMAGIGNGTGIGTAIANGGDYTDGEWHDLVVRFPGASETELKIWLDGVLIGTSATVATGLDSTNGSTLRFGLATAGEPFSGDLERVAFGKNAGDDDDEDRSALVLGSAMLAEDDLALLPFDTDDFAAVWPITDGDPMPNVTETSASKNVGTLNGAVTWNRALKYLQDRYLRIDFAPTLAVDDFFRVGRLIVARAVRPLIEPGSGTPTPFGSPAKLVVDWDMVLSRDHWQEFGYLTMLERGNAPETLVSWGKDVHLIDGGKTLVIVDDILADEPWELQQGTLYGYIDALDGPTQESSNLLRARMTVLGL